MCDASVVEVARANQEFWLDRVPSCSVASPVLFCFDANVRHKMLPRGTLVTICCIELRVIYARATLSIYFAGCLLTMAGAGLFVILPQLTHPFVFFLFFWGGFWGFLKFVSVLVSVLSHESPGVLSDTVNGRQ